MTRMYSGKSAIEGIAVRIGSAERLGYRLVHNAEDLPK